MNDKNTLHPEVRVNKNGVAVTKHVRNDVTAPNAVAKSFPPPKQKQESTPKAVTRQIIKDLEAEGVPLLNSPWGNKNIFHLAKHYPEMLDQVVERVRTSSGMERGVWTHLLADTMQFNPGRAIPDRSIETYRKWMTLLPLCVPLFNDAASTRPANFIYNVESLADAIKKSIDQPYYKTEFEGYDLVKAFMIVIRVDKAAGGTGRVIDRMDDVNFIKENIADVEPLVEMLLTRKSTDRAVIQQMMESSSSSLTSGLL